MTKNNEKNNLAKGLKFILNLSNSKKEKLISILKDVQSVQASELTVKQKAIEIKKIMWSGQSASSKLLIGKLRIVGKYSVIDLESPIAQYIKQKNTMALMKFMLVIKLRYLNKRIYY